MLVELRYAYPVESSVDTRATGAALVLATSGGAAEHPSFYAGFLARPRLSAQLLLSVSRVAADRYYTPAATRDAAIRAADPVVTSNGTMLRFESFSACGGVYGRVDLFGDALDGGFRSTGTTNVDFNPKMRNELALLRDVDPAWLTVGPDEVTLATMGSSVTERRVPLPERWLRGLAEVQVAQVAMVPRFELDGPGTKRFLSALARLRRRGEWWAVPSIGGLGLADKPGPGSVRIAGLERLSLLADHARHAQGLRVWSSADAEPAATAWELDLPASRLTLVLSPAVERGFSGEGGALADVSDPDSVSTAEALRVMLPGSTRLDALELAERTGLAAGLIRRGLNVLASAGAAGYDLSDGAFFGRELPFSPGARALLHPRLRGARALGDEAVVFLEGGMAAVRGLGATYIVGTEADTYSCTCPWFDRHGSSRGPCKHVLAVQIARTGPEA